MSTKHKAAKQTNPRPTKEEVAFMLVASYLATQAYLKQDYQTATYPDSFYQQILIQSGAVVESQAYWQIAWQLDIKINGQDICPSRCFLSS